MIMYFFTLFFLVGGGFLSSEIIIPLSGRIWNINYHTNSSELNGILSKPVELQHPDGNFLSLEANSSDIPNFWSSINCVLNEKSSLNSFVLRFRYRVRLAADSPFGAEGLFLAAGVLLKNERATFGMSSKPIAINETETWKIIEIPSTHFISKTPDMNKGTDPFSLLCVYIHLQTSKMTGPMRFTFDFSDVEIVVPDSGS